MAVLPQIVSKRLITTYSIDLTDEAANGKD